MKKVLWICLLVFCSSMVFSQTEKKPLELTDILKWNRITEQLISNNGEYIVYKEEPWKGDFVLKISDQKGSQLASIIGGTKAQITHNSKFATFTIQPKYEDVRQLKLKKTKKKDLPKNELGIYQFSTNELIRFERLKSYKLPTKWDGWIAFQLEAEKKDLKKDTSNKEKKKLKTESAKNGYTLHLYELESGNKIEFPFVSSYVFAKESRTLAFISSGDEKKFKAGVYQYDFDTNTQTLVFESKANLKQLSIKDDGSFIAFLCDPSEDKKKNKVYDLYLWDGNDIAEKVVTKENVNIPSNWELSEHGKISFAKTADRLFFGTAPIRPKKDTTILEEEIPVLDVWVWNEDVLQTQQIHNKKRDLKKTYLAVYHIKEAKVVQLETKKFSSITKIADGDADQFLATSYWPYAVQTMWESHPYHQDFYLVNVATGVAKMFKKDERAYPSVSPAGKYIYWYNAIDTSWNTYHIASAKEYKITTAKSVQVANELNDVPNPPGDYGSPGWLKDDEALLIYDRYDIWAVDPQNVEEPLNITKNGRLNSTSYRLKRFDLSYRGELKGLDKNEEYLVSAHHNITHYDGLFKVSLRKQNEPKEIFNGPYMLGRRILKAKGADKYLYTKEDYQTYPNLLLSDKKFKKTTQISDAAPQQDDFLWGTTELIEWNSLDGKKLQGTLHKPAGFDPTKKYPMIVNFYSKNSHRLYSYRMPENHRSTIDYHYYTSHGYVIFNPDVYYKTGYPGEDAFNCVMPGITSLLNLGFIDKERIGAQGHSWGGYQVAYLATRTNLFAAIESGAPVVNMFSAYGGIRWGSGLNRSFQYEHTQSRIGKSIWESPLRYIENSPLFTLDKVNTPILIMHNDKDGAVPWYQGIEFFIGLRRLQKPVWLLNYNQADHWPLKVRDKHDFQIRLAQFFDHYLKDVPMPKWMKEGIPAVNKGFDMGYELTK